MLGKIRGYRKKEKIRMLKKRLMGKDGEKMMQGKRAKMGWIWEAARRERMEGMPEIKGDNKERRK